MSEKEQLLERLQLLPGDWQARITLIEMAIREGDVSFAKRLVRASPSDLPTPPEMQIRVHTLLTKGLATPEPALAAVVPVPVPPEQTCDLPIQNPPHREVESGLNALIENETPFTTVKKSEWVRGKTKNLSPDLSQARPVEKWADYDGDLELVGLDRIESMEDRTTAPKSLPSLSLALMAHVLFFILIGLVTLGTSPPDPPQLVVSVSHDRIAELVTTRLMIPTMEVISPTLAAASAAQSVDVITSVAGSTFNAPDVEKSDGVILSTLLAGVQPLGTGMSFAAGPPQASEISFFGLSGRGDKIVFVIDATPAMLVDEKGGMAAYDKVKTEIGIMLANLNRATHFNILLYQGKRLVAFRDGLVPGLPSNLRLAIDWLDPLNRQYESLGLRQDFGPTFEVTGQEGLPIEAVDVAHYTKAIQKAMEWQANAVFCIISGYNTMARSPTPEMLKMMAANPPTPASVDRAGQKAWQAAGARTRDWLAKENAARMEKGISPKVVVDFNRLVREITGATPPARWGGNAVGPAAAMSRVPPVTPADIEEQIDKLVKSKYKAEGMAEPSLHMVLFLGEEEDFDTDEDHFKNLTRKNRGKLKILRGLAALQDMTGAK